MRTLASQPLHRPARLSSICWALLVAAAVNTAVAAAAAPASAEAVYQQERAVCLNGSSSQDRATCLKEAGAARAEARRHSLHNGESAAQLRRNAMARCAHVANADRSDCRRLALGQGQQSGSVAEGAVVKQITTRTPSATAASAP